MNNTARFTVFILSVLAIMLILSASVAEAYVGPGPGLTVIGALWAVIAAVLLAFLAILRWPLRYLIRKIKGKGAGSPPAPESDEDTVSKKQGPDDEG